MTTTRLGDAAGNRQPAAAAAALAAQQPTPGKGNALITGGAGGIGSAITARLKADGFTVFITDIDRAAGEKAGGDLGAVFIEADCASEADMRRAVTASAPV